MRLGLCVVAVALLGIVSTAPISGGVGKKSAESTESAELAVERTSAGGNETEVEEAKDGDELVASATPAAKEEERPMTTAEMLAEARSHSARLMKGGFVEFAEWLFVFILVAPGTFPAFGCVILSCASFWRRRLPGVAEDDDEEEEEPMVIARSGDRDQLRVRGKDEREVEIRVSVGS